MWGERCAATAALVCVMTACGAGERGATPAAHTDSAHADSVSVTPPSPGFTSAQGTVRPAGAPEMAAAATPAALRLAPGPTAAMDAQVSAAERAGVREMPAGDGQALVVGRCLVCHSANMLTQQHKDTAGWNKTVTQMTAWGAPVTASERPVLVAYLAEHYPARAAAAGAARPAP